MKHTYVILFTPVRPVSEADRHRITELTAPWVREQAALDRGLEPRILGAERAHRGAELSGTAPLSALLFLRAGTLEEAAEVAASHPAVQFGYHVEVRPWAPPQRPVA